MNIDDLFNFCAFYHVLFSKLFIIVLTKLLRPTKNKQLNIFKCMLTIARLKLKPMFEPMKKNAKIVHQQ
jgi:hypothetical protein